MLTMRIILLITVFVSTLLIGCKSNKYQVNRTDWTISKIKNVGIPAREYSIPAVLWQQHAAEYGALAYQAFYIAKIQLDENPQPKE